MWVWAATAFAGDLGLYTAACRLVDEHYLWPERVDHEAMFLAAAERLEDRVEPVLVTTAAGQARIEVGSRRWVVNWREDLPTALSELEDAVRASGVELDEDFDLRAELLKGALSKLDRHTVVLVGEGLERFDERLSGTLSGIGVTLGLDGGELTVMEVYPNSPAERAGIRVGDRFVRVDGLATDGMTPADATSHLRGHVGSAVTVEVARGAERLSLEMVRAEITIPNVVASAGPRGVGVVTIDHFSEQTVPNLERALRQLREQGLLSVGLVIDLRGNSGGSLVQSARSVDTFVDEGRIVSTNGRGGEHVPGLLRSMDAHVDAHEPLPPIIVLVDHDTASGAEILSGALGQLGRAALLGETTFGKGTVQTLWSLGDGIKLKLTVAEYTVGDEVHVHEVGIIPDLALYPVQVKGGQLWYPDAARLRSRLGVDTPLLYYPDLGKEPPERDDTLDLAAAILSAGAAPSRDGVLGTERVLLPTLRALQATRVDEATRSLSLDWSPAAASPDNVDVEVSPGLSSPARAGAASEVQFTVTNRGSELHRVAIRMRSVNPDVDDHLLAIGALAEGESRVVRGVLVPDIASASRTDRLVGVLECDGCTPAPVVDQVFTVEGGVPPAVKVSAAAVGDVLRLEVTNSGISTLTGVVAHVPFPDIAGVELAAPTSRATVLGPGETTLVEQRLVVAPGVEGPLALRVEIAADGFPALAKWELPVPLGGATLRRDAPVVEVTTGHGHQPVGTAVVQVHLADADGLEHVVVYAGSARVDRGRWDANVAWDQHKVLYREGLGRKARFGVTVPVRPGSNRIVVVAEDQTGARTRRELYIYGDGSAPTDDGVAFGP